MYLVCYLKISDEKYVRFSNKLNDLIHQAGLIKTNTC